MSPSKDRKSRKQLFDTIYNIDDIQSLTQEFSVLESDDIDDIHNLTDVFSVLDISSNADNNEFNTCISTDTFPTSENQSRGHFIDHVVCDVLFVPVYMLRPPRPLLTPTCKLHA